MCGFAGFIGFSNFSKDKVESIASNMGDAIFHRGPDDFGIWLDDSAEIVLAHRRLSILDLSMAGHQPMISPSGRFVITYNGEIYNHNDLRAKLTGLIGKERDTRRKVDWKGSSDTETLLALIEADGIASALEQVVGMFAFALWDRKEKSLYLVRDRMGEKPLYYGWQKGVFLFWIRTQGT